MTITGVPRTVPFIQTKCLAFEARLRLSAMERAGAGKDLTAVEVIDTSMLGLDPTLQQHMLGPAAKRPAPTVVVRAIKAKQADPNKLPLSAIRPARREVNVNGSYAVAAASSYAWPLCATAFRLRRRSEGKTPPSAAWPGNPLQMHLRCASALKAGPQRSPFSIFFTSM